MQRSGKFKLLLGKPLQPRLEGVRLEKKSCPWQGHTNHYNSLCPCKIDTDDASVLKLPESESYT